jgi:site-specific DNA-methyltransferase (adenine-specific)
MNEAYNKIFNTDCREGLKQIPENSIDVCITDPPYNYEFVGHKWDADEVKRRLERAARSEKTLVKNLPYGSGLAGGVRNERWYTKYQENLDNYQHWTYEWGTEVFRVLKPGAYILVFNSSRTIAHIQIAMEKAGFFTRDIMVWKKNAGIPKGLNYAKKLEKMGEDGSKWNGWHSSLRNEWEAIGVLQKPLVNNYMTTVTEFGVGLMKAENGDSFMSNIIENIPRDKKEDFNVHCTVKPTALIEKLIELTVPLEASRIVLDPFMGSGTTAVAAIRKGVGYLGYELVEEYCDIASGRIAKQMRTTHSLPMP